MSLAFLFVSLLLFGFVQLDTLLIAAAIAALGIVYSHPRIHAKGIPLVCSGLHLVGGALHFLLGYSLRSGVDRRGVLIGLYFALIFVAGHLNQEVRDYDGDRVGGILTNAVWFGKMRIFVAGLFVFALSYVYLLGMVYSGLVPRGLGWLILLLPVHLILYGQTLRMRLTFHSVSRYQTSYQMLYALIGALIVLAVL